MTPRKTAARDEVGTTTLLVKTRSEGRFKITIPVDWKVTFGKAMQGRGFEEERELRIYEAETKQRACFTGVLSFRDLSIPLVREIKSKSGESSWEDDGEGNVVEKRAVKTTIKEIDD